MFCSQKSEERSINLPTYFPSYFIDRIWAMWLIPNLDHRIIVSLPSQNSTPGPEELSSLPSQGGVTTLPRHTVAET